MRAFLLCAMVLVGCGGSSTSDPAANTGGTSGSGGSGAVGGSGVGGSTGGSSGTGATSGAGGTGALTGSCTDFVDQPLPPNPVTIRIKNGKDVPIYLGGDTGNCGPSELFSISNIGGPFNLHAGGCGYTCEALQQHGDECPDSCFLPPTIYIVPGGTYEVAWSGTVFETAQMATECYFEPQYAYDSCWRRITPPAGSYSAATEAGTQIICLDIGLCSCEPDKSGSCEIPYGGSPSGDMVQATQSFSMPAPGVVEITFQ